MAKAKITQSDVEVTLTLSGPEARTLVAVLGGAVTGSSKRSPRKHTDAVWSALRAAGVRADIEQKLLSPGNYMFFKDYPEDIDGAA